MKNLELLQQGYKDFATGNMAGPDIVWNSCIGIPYINETGIYQGAQAIVNGVFAHIPNYFDGFNIEISEFIDRGDKIAVVGFYTGIWKATGKKFKANAVHVWTFKDQKVTHFFEAADTAAVMNN